MKFEVLLGLLEALMKDMDICELFAHFFKLHVVEMITCTQE